MSKREFTTHHIYGTDIQAIVQRMKEITALIEDRVKEMGTENRLVLRSDSEIKSLWRKLCVLHMRGLVICEERARDLQDRLSSDESLARGYSSSSSPLVHAGVGAWPDSGPSARERNYLLFEIALVYWLTCAPGAL